MTSSDDATETRVKHKNQALHIILNNIMFHQEASVETIKMGKDEYSGSVIHVPGHIKSCGLESFTLTLYV